MRIGIGAGAGVADEAGLVAELGRLGVGDVAR